MVAPGAIIAKPFAPPLRDTRHILDDGIILPALP
jgi:hypothetical protein